MWKDFYCNIRVLTYNWKLFFSWKSKPRLETAKKRSYYKPQAFLSWNICVLKKKLNYLFYCNISLSGLKAEEFSSVLLERLSPTYFCNSQRYFLLLHKAFDIRAFILTALMLHWKVQSQPWNELQFTYNFILKKKKNTVSFII